MLSKEAFDALGPVLASHGWVFFGPYRGGQGLSASAGPYIGDQIAAAKKNGGISAGAAAMVRLLETDYLNDQLACIMRIDLIRLRHDDTSDVFAHDKAAARVANPLKPRAAFSEAIGLIPTSHLTGQNVAVEFDGQIVLFCVS